MKNPIGKIEDLKGGKLGKIMAYYMLDKEKDQKKFLEIADKNKGNYKDLLNDYESIYGYKPAKEFIELEECMNAYKKYFEDISDVWMLEGGISYIGKLKDKKINFNNLDMFTILTGLLIFGSDPSGDSCFLNTLLNPIDTAEVYGYDHETGKLNGYIAYSLADFISNNWSSSYDEESGEESEKLTKEIKGIIKLFNAECKKEIKKRPFYHSPEILLKRANWIMGHTSGEPVHRFAEKMSDAPTFKDWEKEKALITKIPVIANYWLLAHFFLGNTNACMECTELAKKTPGKITPALAEIIEKALNNFGKKGFKFFGLEESDIKKIIADTQKNASNELLEPEIKKQIEKSRGEDKITKLSEAEFKDKIKSGSDPMDIINEYPEDVETHDRALKEIGKNDKDFLSLVEEYFKRRTGNPNFEWPRDEKKLDKRLSIPVCAAFCSGLKFDLDNEKSYAGITKTLGKYDDENSIKAYMLALDSLNPSDNRLEYIIENLKVSKRPEVKEVILRGAWRFFEILKLAKDNEEALNKNREKYGLNLDNMFNVENYFLNFVRMVLDYNNEESIKLSEAILKESSNYQLGIFNTTIGRAFRIIGNHKLDKHLEYIKWYVKAVGDLQPNGNRGFVDKVTLFNFTEACITYVKIAGANAEPQLKELFGRTTESKYFDLDIKSGTIGGLLILKPNDDDLLNWIKRLSGNRNNNIRIYGALRAVYEAKLDETAKEKVKPWVKYHLYSQINNFFPHHYVLKDTAKETAEKLGETNFEGFDEDSKYCIGLKYEDFADAFLKPEKYWPEYICKKIVEKKYKHPALLNRLKDYLVDMLEYISDDMDHFDDYWEGLKALFIQGVDAFPVFQDLLNFDYGLSTTIIYMMRFVESEASILEWIHKADDKEILKQLDNPEPRFIPWLDLLAAHAFFFNTDESKKTIENAFKSRIDRIHGYDIYAEEEPTSVRLPMIYASYGKQSHETLMSYISEGYDEYARKQLIDKVLKLKEFKYNNEIFKDKKQLKLNNKIKGENNSCGWYTFIIECKDNAINFNCIAENIYFHDVVNNRGVESSGSIQCENEEKALELAIRIANEYMLIGYNEIPDNLKKSKK